ncbi:hypothetical protein AGOR_G00000560 [Albula goreensis]|uniref:Uncharacterized protein n=1 Tax=Albula goreensis TaxID=1534307 RepID=A0A8T3EAC8_9TELE|nr:hypothetical protein AGOR_G00000560 [Albula goreensis]
MYSPSFSPINQTARLTSVAVLSFHNSQNIIGTMGKGCITATKYFLFLFNLLFFIFGALIMGFGLWVLLDNQSFIAVCRLRALGSVSLIRPDSRPRLLTQNSCGAAAMDPPTP